MPPVNELRWPSRMGARVWARTPGAVRPAASAAPVLCCMNLRRDRRRASNFDFFIDGLPGLHYTAGIRHHTRRDQTWVARALERSTSRRGGTSAHGGMVLE